MPVCSRLLRSSRKDGKFQQLLAHAEERVFDAVLAAVETRLEGAYPYSTHEDPHSTLQVLRSNRTVPAQYSLVPVQYS